MEGQGKTRKQNGEDGQAGLAWRKDTERSDKGGIGCEKGDFALAAGIASFFTAASLSVFSVCEGRRLVTAAYRIRDPRIRKKIRFVFLSDLHEMQYGKGNRRLLQAIWVASPDAVLVGGDMVLSGCHAGAGRSRALLETLSGRYPVYYANGNHETRNFSYSRRSRRVELEYRQALRKAGVILLEDSGASFPESNVSLYGLDIPYDYYHDWKKGLPPGEVRRRLGPADRGRFTVLLSHNPDWFDDCADWGADLTLAGHLHGGVVRLPLVGGVLSTTGRLFPKYDGGMFCENGRRMIVSRGLGTHTIPFRPFNPAELVVIELVPDNGRPRDANRKPKEGKNGSAGEASGV